MEINLSVNGDPGTGNSFNDTKIRKVDNYNLTPVKSTITTPNPRAVLEDGFDG